MDPQLLFFFFWLMTTVQFRRHTNTGTFFSAIGAFIVLSILVVILTAISSNIYLNSFLLAIALSYPDLKKARPIGQFMEYYRSHKTLEERIKLCGTMENIFTVLAVTSFMIIPATFFFDVPLLGKASPENVTIFFDKRIPNSFFMLIISIPSALAVMTYDSEKRSLEKELLTFKKEEEERKKNNEIEKEKRLREIKIENEREAKIRMQEAKNRERELELKANADKKKKVKKKTSGSIEEIQDLLDD